MSASLMMTADCSCLKLQNFTSKVNGGTGLCLLTTVTIHSRVSRGQNVNEMTATMNYLNVSSETLLYNSSLIEAELDALEERLRALQAQADDDTHLIDKVTLK